MSVELHLPDLPEVPISIGSARGGPSLQARHALAWHARWREALASYVPLLLMLVLALATWWLVKNSPNAPGPAPAEAVRTEPDYTMTGFALERFDASGRMTLRVSGARMQHFPATDRIEIDDVQIRATAPSGRLTLAHAQRALSNGDGSEVQLLGAAEVTSEDAHAQPMVMRSEFLHLFLVTERVQSHRPVWVKLGASELRAAGLLYDHVTRRLDLSGPMRLVLAPRGAPP
jgi:lipopolysaccharide export system protein LptC